MRTNEFDDEMMQLADKQSVNEFLNERKRFYKILRIMLILIILFPIVLFLISFFSLLSTPIHMPNIQ